MRRILCLLLVSCLVGTVANAQIVTSKSRLVTKVKKPQFEKTFYLAGGAQLNVVENKYYTFRPGYDGVFGYEQNFKRSRKTGSQFGMEIGVTSRGWGYEQRDVRDNHTYPSFYLSPFNYSYRAALDKKGKTWLEPHVGAYVSYDLNDDEGHNDWWYSTSYSYESSLQFRHDRADRADVGLNIGLRLWLAGRVSLDLAFQQGLFTFAENEWSGNLWDYDMGWTSRWIEEEHKGRSGSLVLRIGVKLNK